jgi:hypothetical protein
MLLSGLSIEADPPGSHVVVRYTFLATAVFPPLRNTTGTTLEFKQLFRKGFVNTSSQHLTKKVNSGLLFLFLLRYKQFT